MVYVIKESDYDFKDIVEGNLRSMITKQVANTHNKQFGGDYRLAENNFTVS